MNHDFSRNGMAGCFHAVREFLGSSWILYFGNVVATTNPRVRGLIVVIRYHPLGRFVRLFF